MSKPMYVVSLLARQEDNQPQSTFEALRVGTLHDRALTITQEMLDEYVVNFEKKAYNGAKVFVNLNHMRGTASAGEIVGAEVKGESLWLTVDWTVLGVEQITQKLYNYISVELIHEMPHWKTGKPVKNVLGGAALTNDPALGGLDPLELERLAKLSSHNPSNMETFKVFLELLSSKKTVLATEKKALVQAFEALDETEQAEVKEEVAAVEAMPETEEETPEAKEAREKAEAEAKAKADADAAAKTEELKKKDSEVATLSKRLEVLEKEKEEAKEALRSSNLSKKVDTLMFSAETEKGFVATEKENLLSFLSSLTDEQVEKFEGLIGKFTSLSMEDVGASNGAAATDAESITKAAEALSKKEGISLRDAYKRVTSETK